MNRIVPSHPHDASSAQGLMAGPLRHGTKIGLVAVGVVALVLLVYTTLWALTGYHLRSGVLEWIAARQGEGYRIAHGGVGFGGYPLRARVTVRTPVIAAPDGRAFGWSLAVERADLEAVPLRPGAVTLRLSGEEAFSINVDGKLRTYRGGAEELALHATGGRLPVMARLSVRKLAMAAEEPGDALTIERLGVRAEPADGAPEDGSALASAYVVALEGGGITLPLQLDLPLGETFASVAADAVVRGPFATGTELPAALLRWRDGGGFVELAHLGIGYGPLSLEGSGSLALDQDVQPTGTVLARIRGAQETVMVLSARGLVDERSAANLRIALAVLARPPADGGEPTLSVPLTLRERTLSVGPIPFLTVPTIEWPRGPRPRTDDPLPAAPRTP